MFKTEILTLQFFGLGKTDLQSTHTSTIIDWSITVHLLGTPGLDTRYFFPGYQKLVCVWPHFVCLTVA